MNIAGYAESKLSATRATNYAVDIARLIGVRASLSGDNSTFLSALLISMRGQVETPDNDDNYKRVVDALAVTHGVATASLSNAQIADGLRVDSYWQTVAGV